MVILKQSWVVARDFLVYLMSVIAFIIYLDLIACWKWLYSSENYTYLNLLVRFSKLYILWLIFCVSVARCVFNFFCVCKIFWFFCDHVLHWGGCLFFQWILWRHYILTPDHIELFKCELFAIIIYTLECFLLWFYGSFWFLNLLLMSKGWMVSVSRFWAVFTFFRWNFFAMLKFWLDECFQGVALNFSFSKQAQISVTASVLGF